VVGKVDNDPFPSRLGRLLKVVNFDQTHTMRVIETGARNELRRGFSQVLADAT
jgi:hypothetical protein